MFSYLLWHRCCLYSFSFDIVRFFSINRMEQWCEVCLEAWRAVISSPHKCASCSLFTPSATCHEQALCWRILVMLLGISLSNREVPVTCQWWWGSVKLWAVGTVVRLDVRASEQVCVRTGELACIWSSWWGDVEGMTIGCEKVVCTQKHTETSQTGQLQMGREAGFNFQPSREVKQHCQGSVTLRYH